MTLSPIRSTLSRLSSPLSRQTSKVDPELRMYARQAEEEEKTKQKKFQPLQFVLDLLQRGQYLTANIADEIEESFRTGRPLGESTLETLKAAWQGVTGARKGDWETLLFGGNIEGSSDQGGERGGWLPEDFKKMAAEPLIRWGKEGSSGLAEGILRPRKLIGLAANIALDPTTYLSFGATKAAQVAASKYADDVVKLTIGTMGASDWARLGDQFQKLVGKNADDVLKVVKGSKVASRHFEKIYNNAFQTALRNPEKVLLEELAPRLDEINKPLTEMVSRGTGGGLEKVESTLLERNPGLETIMQSIKEGYEGAGTRAMKFMGKEAFKGERYPAAVRQMDMFKKAFGESKIGKSLGNAWWAVMNNGPVGTIRKALGFRNPYQQMLHFKQRDAERFADVTAHFEARKIDQVINKYGAAKGDDITKRAVDARFKAEQIAHDLGMYDTKAYMPLAPDVAITPEVKYRLLNNKETKFQPIDEIEEYIRKMISDMRYPSEAKQYVKVPLGPDEPDPETIKDIFAKIGIPKDKVPKAVTQGIRDANDVARKYGFNGIGDYINARKRGRFLSSDYSGFNADLARDVTNRTSAGETADLFGGAQDILSSDPSKVPIVRNLLNEEWFRKQIGVTTDEEVQTIKGIWDDLDQMQGEWLAKEKEAAQAAGKELSGIQRLNYFHREVGSGPVSSGGVTETKEGFAKSKKITNAQAVENNAQVFKFVMGPQLKRAFDELPTVNGRKLFNNIELQDYDDFVRAWVQDHGLTEANIDLVDAMKLRAIDHAKFMGRMRLVQDMKQFGIPIDEVARLNPELTRPLNTQGEGLPHLGLFKAKDEIFNGYLFDKDVIDVINNVGSILSSDEATRQVASWFARSTAWWKGMATLSPGFTLRNFQSNNWSGFIKYGPRWFLDQKKVADSIALAAYVTNPDKYADLLTETLKESPGKIASRLNSVFEGGPLTLKELGDYIRREGVAGTSGQVSREIGEAAGTTLNPLSSKWKGFDISRGINNMVENQSKVLSFLHSYSDVAKKGSGVGQSIAEKMASQKRYLEFAKRETDKWFIDYGDLAPGELQLKKLIPFYTWIRKNLANQLSGIVLYPNMYSLVPKVRGAIKDDEDFDYSLMPDYMENLGYYPVGRTAGGETLMRWANIPLEDLNKIPLLFEGNRPIPNLSLREFATDVVSNAHPWIKSVIELASGKDLFRQRDIKGLERANSLFQYLNKSPKVVEFIDGLLRKAGVQEGLKIVPTADGTELKINGTVARMMENNLPILKAINLLVETPEAIAEQINPNIETWIERISGKKDYYEGLNEVFSLVSQLAGSKFKSIVEEEEAQKRDEMLMRRAEELRSEARRQLPGYQKKREKSLAARRKRVARYF